MKPIVAAASLMAMLACLPLLAEETYPSAADGLAGRFGQLDRLDASRDAAPTMGQTSAPLGRGVAARGAVSEGYGFIQTEHELTVDGRERTYIVQSPKQPRGELPVVFFFHGGGGRGASMAAVGFRDMTAQEQFLAVYPDGWRGNWNDGRQAAGIAAQVEGVDDVKFVRAMVEDLARRHKIDRSLVFAAGVSNGGIFSHYLAARAADLIAGIAPVIGGLAEPVAATFRPSYPISLLVIQGDADPLVPIGGGAIARTEGRGRIISTEAMLKLYLAHNGIAGAPEIERLPDLDPDDGTTTEVRRWPPGRDGARVAYYLVRGGGHTMPGVRLYSAGERTRWSGKTSRDFNAFRAIWDFFKSCPPRKQELQAPAQEQAGSQATLGGRPRVGSSRRLTL